MLTFFSSLELSENLLLGPYQNRVCCSGEISYLGFSFTEEIGVETKFCHRPPVGSW